MPKIVIQATLNDGSPGTVTFTERTVPTNLHNDHYVVQLIERIGWALGDAEQIEAAHDRDIATPRIADDGGAPRPAVSPAARTSGLTVGAPA